MCRLFECALGIRRKSLDRIIRSLGIGSAVVCGMTAWTAPGRADSTPGQRAAGRDTSWSALSAPEQVFPIAPPKLFVWPEVHAVAAKSSRRSASTSKPRVHRSHDVVQAGAIQQGGKSCGEMIARANPQTSIVHANFQASSSPLSRDEPLADEPMPQAAPPALGDAPPAPVQLFRRITQIDPYHDYDPDGKPCDHLCPDTGDCPEGTEACPDEPEFYSSAPAGRNFAEVRYQWAASDLYHRPLYFEDVALERYGQVQCCEFAQTFKSLGKFGLQLGGLPYQVLCDPPGVRRYVLGYYRPGDCAPPLHYTTPFNDDAGVATSSCELFSPFAD